MIQPCERTKSGRRPFKALGVLYPRSSLRTLSPVLSDEEQLSAERGGSDHALSPASAMSGHPQHGHVRTAACEGEERGMGHSSSGRRWAATPSEARMSTSGAARGHTLNDLKDTDDRERATATDHAAYHGASYPAFNGGAAAVFWVPGANSSSQTQGHGQPRYVYALGLGKENPGSNAGYPQRVSN